MISKVTFTPPTAGASAITLHDPANDNTRFLSQIDGVVGPPPPRDVTRTRPGLDGITDQTTYIGERIITLEGQIAESTGGVSLSTLSTISEAFYASLLSPGTLTVTYENGTVRFCKCKLSGGVELSITGATGASRFVDYQVQLRASDPRWYSTSLTTRTITAPGSGTSWTGSLTSIAYSGTAPTPVNVLVTAGTNQLTVNEIAVSVPSAYGSLVAQSHTSSNFTNPCLSIVGDFTVAGSSTRTFYSASRTATSYAGVSASSEFLYVYPGTVRFDVKGTATTSVSGASVQFTYYDAFW